jgi:PLP dependent protein
MDVTENIALIREGLGAHPTKLIAVTKFATANQIEEAFETGVTEFGENRLQDALAKRDTLPSYLVNESNWHFIGHLQSNKVRQAVGKFALIHSVDSVKLATEISRASVQKNLVQPILLQVKMAVDPTKTGFEPGELKKEFATIVSLPNIECRGLMAITPAAFGRKDRIFCFDELRKLRDDLAREHSVVLPELSMGMSDDWREAVSCGSTMIRIGSAIFNNRAEI